MDNGWDHTENEQIHLIRQVTSMGMVKDTHVSITGFNTISRGGCSDNMGRSGEQELVSLSSVYGKHFSSVVINNYNYYNHLDDLCDVFNFISIFIFSISNSICFIDKIINIKKSIIEFFNNKIYFIKPDYPLIYLTFSKIDCHINILKKHYCDIKSCACCIQRFMIDIQSTHIDSLNTYYISKYIAEFDRLTRLLKSIEFDLNESKPLISKLCNIKDDLDLIILNLGSLTWSFGFIIISYNDRLQPQIDSIKCIKQYIDLISSNFTVLEFNFNILKKSDFFNTFFLQISNKILYVFLQCSLQSLSTHLINHNITTNWHGHNNNIGDLQMNNGVMNLMSRIVIIESIFVVSRLYKYFKIKSEIDEIFQLLQNCPCYKFYNIIYKVGVKDIQLPEATHVNDNPHQMLYSNNKMINEGNKACLCLVVRYILLNDLYVLMRYHEYLGRDLLSCMSRSYKNYSYSLTHNLNVSKLIMLIIRTLNKIILWMKKRFIGYKDCYCVDVNNRYYQYLVSITLYLSSLIENVWTMDPESIRMAIQNVSLMIEFDNVYFEINCLKLVKSEKKEIVSLYDIYTYTIRIILFMLKIDKTTKELTPHKCSCIICVNMKLVKNIQIFSKRVPILPKIIDYLLETIQKLVTRCQMIKVYQYFADVIYKIFEKIETCDFQDKIINSINQISNIYTSLVKKIMVDVESGIINNCKCDTCTNGKITCLCINLLHELIATLRLGKGENNCGCHCQTINSKCNPLRIECDCTKCCIICLDYNEIMNCLCCINNCCNESNGSCIDENSNCCENVNNGKNGDKNFSIFECQCKNIFEMIKKCSPSKKLLCQCVLKKECCVKRLNAIHKGVLITIVISKAVSDHINKFNINEKLSLLDGANMKIEYIKYVYEIINIHILSMTKKNLIISNSHPHMNNENRIESRNWGYDTHFEQ